jgi:hypothetical protein
MTPNNIINMSVLQELDFIAVTDHNSLKQIETCLEIADGMDLVVIPGIECEVSEGFHVVCLFKTLTDALSMDEFVESKLPIDPINEKFYGEQVLMDEFDEEVSHYPNLLLNSLDVTYDNLYKKVKELGGVLIFAHIDKGKDGSLNYIVEQDYIADGIEITKHTDDDELLEKYPKLKTFKIFHNSDAHQIYDISERKNFIDLEEKSIDAFFKWMEE